jgi:hypothetical protein
MLENAQITESVLRLKSSMEQDDYKGFDPYDGLQSPVFRLPILCSNHTVRFLAQQAIKRSPLNLRSLLGISKGENPVTLGLVIQSHVHLKRAGLLDDFAPTRALVQRLIAMRSPGYAFTCWGYDFPWASKHAEIPAYGPTVVATGIIANALFLFWEETGCEQSAELVCESCDFVTNSLFRTVVKTGGFVFSYSPFDQEAVLNASMKAVRLLSQGHTLKREKGYLDLAKAALKPVLATQRSDGSWPYSFRKQGTWTDNYHSGYILDCIDEYVRHSGDELPKPSLERGLSFYQTHFIGSNGRPNFYSNRAGQADCTAGGQTLLTLSRFGKFDKAKQVAGWMILNMQDKKGHFHYRKNNCVTNATNFMRWSNAWMLAGLSALLATDKKKEDMP